jgi:hypothetical protein
VIKPVSDWISSYEEMFFKDITAAKMPTLWGKWVHKNTTGLAAAAPWSGANVTLNEAAFPPITLPPNPTPALICNMISSGWVAYISSALWTPPPPAPPFSVISLVSPSPTGIAAAQPALFSALMAAFGTPPNIAPGFTKIQATQIGTAFYTATMSSGIMLTGLTIPVPPAPPLPLVLPMMPVM